MKEADGVGEKERGRARVKERGEEWREREREGGVAEKRRKKHAYGE